MVQVRKILIVLAFAVATAKQAHAQASPYLPVDDISYKYVDALMSRGMLRGLSALERPYHVAQIRASLDSIASDTSSRSSVVNGYVALLSQSIARYEIRKHDDPPGTRAPLRAKASFDVYATGQSSSLRELMLADWHNDVKPGVAGYFVMGGGHLASSVRALLDNRLNTDPEFEGRKDRSIAGRVEDAYLSGQWKYAEASFGRVGRSWGPIGFSGLQLGDDAYTYDHFYGRFGTDRIHVAAVAARLENQVYAPGLETHRYFSTHRLGIRRGGFEMGLSESYLYTGVRRGLEFSLINPFNVFALSWRNERTDGNLSFGGDASYRTKKLGTFSADLLLDDVQIDKCDSTCKEPSSYAMTFSAEGLPLFSDQKWFASYTRVTNLAYRTPNVAETYEVRGVGLGRGFSDYDEARVGIDLALVPRSPLKLYVAHRRQGEGDYRNAFPPEVDYPTTPVFLSGVVWTTNRIGLSGASIIARDFEIVGDGGINISQNRFHVEGLDKTKFEGRVKVIWVPRWLIPFD